MNDSTKLKLVVALPAIIKGSAFVLMGIGGVANALGYPDVGGWLLGAAAIFGLKDTTIQQQNAS